MGGGIRLKKVALFAFNGDPMCFIHVLLNGLDMHAKGQEIKIIMEGTATRLVTELDKPGSPLKPLWEKARQLGLIDGVCKACSNKMGTLAAAEEQKLKPLDEMSGHPSMARYMAEGFEVISF
jgi:hypothetical protein